MCRIFPGFKHVKKKVHYPRCSAARAMPSCCNVTPPLRDAVPTIYRTIPTALLLAASLVPARSDEGMLTFNNFPADRVEQAYGFKPDQRWLDHLRLSSLWFAHGCSGAFRFAPRSGADQPSLRPSLHPAVLDLGQGPHCRWFLRARDKGRDQVSRRRGRSTRPLSAHANIFCERIRVYLLHAGFKIEFKRSFAANLEGSHP
jgi:hypothetical protein